MIRSRLLALVATVLLLAATGVSLACEVAGPSTHVGVVTAVDPTKNTVTLTHAADGKLLSFVAEPALLKGIAVKDEVKVVYRTEGKTLRATSITKS